MADSSASLAGIIYYAREKYYQHIQTEVLEVVKKYGADPVLTYWKAYSLVMSGRLHEGMRELERILDKPEVILSAPMLLTYAHKQCETVDRQEVQTLEAKVRTERTSCGEKALYNASMFLWLCGRHDKAREYVDRMLKMSATSAEGLALKGWIDLTSGRETLAKRSIKFFEEALAGSGPKLTEALFGKSKFYFNRYNFSHSLDVLNQLVAAYDGFLPALVEKMRVQLALQDWEQAVETAHRCLGEDAGCIEAIRLLTLNLLVHEGKYTEAADRIGELIQLIDRFEPNNHALYCDVSLAFARLCGGKELILQQTMTLVNRALSLSPTNAEYIIELAYQLYLNNQLKESLVQYKKAMNIDETSVAALAGIILCQILEGHTLEAEHQLEFLAEVQSSIGKQAPLIFLNALLAQKKNTPANDVLPIINETVDVHFSTVKGTPLSMKYFQLVNPHFLLQIAKLLLMYAPTQPPSTSTQVDPVLRKASAVMDPLYKSSPGLSSSLLVVAKIKFLSGEPELAQSILQRLIESDNTSMEAHLLMSKIQLHRGNVKQCSASLEMALSSNFEVQNYAVYHLVKGQCEASVGDLPAALTSLQAAMGFLTRRSAKAKVSRLAATSLLPPLTLSEQVTVYLELAGIHTKMDQTHEATKVIQDALNEFTGTSEEFRITLANADFALARGKSEEALAMLRDVDEDNRYYIQAKEKMASIYLNIRKNKKKYIACYEELAKKMPGPPTALILGDAYMSIQEPEKALEVYEVSLRRNARDSVLASKVGQALIRTHNYNKAIIYYETALKSDTQQFLRKDLAELFLKLRQFEKAEKVIQVALDQGGEIELSQMMEKVEYMKLQSRVYREAKQLERALPVLNDASELQTKVLTRVGIEQADSLESQKDVAARIYFDMAEVSNQLGDIKKAVDSYAEALKKKHSFLEARLALAKLYLQQGDLSSCDQECVVLLSVDQDNDEASLMRADLLFYRGFESYQEAIHHLQELLSRKPAHFGALSRYVKLAWRSGELDKAQTYLDMAEKACTRSAYAPGLNYCKGLFKRYQHEANEALQHFNQARKDTEWGEKALFAMIEICLNPENDMVAGEMLKPIVDSGNTADDQIAIKTAEKLLLEVKPCSPVSEQKVRQLECYILLSYHVKANTEKALEKLMTMASTNRNDVGLLLGIASAHVLLKQVPRARNQLKIASKVPWTPDNGEEFEQVWLLLADIYIQSGKYDVALDLLKKCVAYNQSCSKAWEYRGFISEKEHAFKDAALYYEKAWQYNYHANPTVGFKLAFNHLKAKWYVGAIDVCHQVLKKHPNYPKIRTEILDKARVSIRT